LLVPLGRGKVNGNPIEPVPNELRTDARSRERRTCEGITQSLQVRLNKVDPLLGSLACNLLSKDDWRAALSDKMEPGRPDMPLIVKPSSFTCRAERLARARTSPCADTWRPSGNLQGNGPARNPREEMETLKACEVSWLNVFDASSINSSGRYFASGY
jgi:hypothetical protein